MEVGGPVHFLRAGPGAQGCPLQESPLQVPRGPWVGEEGLGWVLPGQSKALGTAGRSHHQEIRVSAKRGLGGDWWPRSCGVASGEK